MPRYKQPTKKALSVSEAWEKEGEIGACRAIISKYAKVIDMTDSGRDIKPLASGMLEAIDRLKSLEARAENGKEETPLIRILKAVDE